MKKKLVLIAMILSFSLMSSTKSHALSIKVFNGITTKICADGGICDQYYDSDTETFVYTPTGTVSLTTQGNGWTSTVSTAVTYPLLGTASNAQLDLNSIDVSSNNGGTIVISASERNYTGPLAPAYLLSMIGGTTDGTITAKVYLNASNLLWGTDVEIASFDALTGYFAAATSGPATAVGPFSITQIVTITHTGSGVSSLDLHTKPVPEPATLLLLGTGLVGLGFLGRRKNGSA